MCFARGGDSQDLQEGYDREELGRLEQLGLLCRGCSLKPEAGDKAGEALCSALHQLELRNWLEHYTRNDKRHPS